MELTPAGMQDRLGYSPIQVSLFQSLFCRSTAINPANQKKFFGIIKIPFRPVKD